MAYRCVIVSNPAHISTRSEQLVVETDERHTVPIEDISALMLESRRATLSAAALSALAQNGTAVFVCDEKHLPCGVLLPYAQHSRQLTVAHAQQTLTLPAKKRLWQQLVIVCIGVLVSSMGVSFYQTSNIGISPYDSLSLIINRRLPRVPYFWCRMSTDVLCAAICYAAGGIVSLGTLISAFGLAPLIHLSNKLVAVPLLAQKQTGAAEAAE